MEVKVLSALVFLCCVYCIESDAQNSVTEFQDVGYALVLVEWPPPTIYYKTWPVSQKRALKLTHFYLWTRQNPTEHKELKIGDESLLNGSGYNSSRSTKIFIHGYFMNGRTNTYVLKLRDEYLKHEDCNFISVDWDTLAHNINYFWSAAYTAPVGQVVGQFINFLVKKGSQLSQFHIIGFSLGAHVAGKTGATVNGRLPRITGLDPAYLGFPEKNTEKRLDESDAEFVDVIHTNGGIVRHGAIGYPLPIGHADFFVNGGYLQPNCGPRPTLDLLDIVTSCSHMRALDYFIESISSQVGFKATRCDSWTHYQARTCTKNPSYLMGDPTKKWTRGNFYLSTNRARPFAKSKINRNQTEPVFESFFYLNRI